MHEFGMIINGQPVKAETTFDVINPATGEPFARAGGQRRACEPRGRRCACGVSRVEQNPR